MAAVAIVHKDAILDQLRKGLRLVDIAPAYGVSPEAITMILSKLPEYQEAKLAHHAARLDNAEKMLEDATDGISLARARELHRAFAWRASVEHARQWGSKQELSITSTSISITHALEQARARVIEGSASLVDEQVDELVLEEQVNPTRTEQEGD